MTDSSTASTAAPERHDHDAHRGVSVSRWLSDAAGDHLRNQLLGDALDTWEVEAGPFSQADLDAAARTLGISASGTP